LHRHAGRCLTALVAPHTVGDDEEILRLIDQEGVFVVLADASDVTSGGSTYEHDKSFGFRSSVGGKCRRMGLTWQGPAPARSLSAVALARQARYGA
jgi:hypothetical protein